MLSFISSDYVDTLMKASNTRVESSTRPEQDLLRAAPPPLCDNFVRPDKDEAVAQLTTRYKRN
jgi:hypothetical protein